MSKPRHPGRYIVYHSAFGEKPCDTLKEAREFVRFVERQTSYAPCIYDTLRMQCLCLLKEVYYED